MVQALSDGVGTSNTRSLSDTQYSELYPSVQPITLVLTGLLDNSDERQKVKDISLYNYVYLHVACIDSSKKLEKQKQYIFQKLNLH